MMLVIAYVGPLKCKTETMATAPRFQGCPENCMVQWQLAARKNKEVSNLGRTSGQKNRREKKMILL